MRHQGRFDSRESFSMPGPGPISLVFTSVFLGFVVGAVIVARLPLIVPLAYGGMSVATFLAYMTDKRAASNGQWRTAERSLHLLSLLCGRPGAMLAQKPRRMDRFDGLGSPSYGKLAVVRLG
ncbi:MAG: DUF1294 domain-containing protein [Planctomycetota bacterium]